MVGADKSTVALALEDTPLTAVERHIVAFFESSVLCLDGRGITAIANLQLARLAPNSAALLQDVDLSRNELVDLSHVEIQPLLGLVALDLSFNRLEMFPAALCQLLKLEELNLRGNNILATRLPSAEELGALQHLRSLDLSRNHLSFLPAGLYGLTALETLNLSSNR